MAFVDALYGALGIIGSTLPDRFLGDHRVAVHVLAALVLGAFGFLMLRAREDSPAIAERGMSGRDLSASFAGAALLSAPNPGAVPIFAALFAAVGIGTVAAAWYVALALAAFLGAMIWW